MMGTRFLLVGIGMYVFLRLRGAPGPNLREWWWSTIIGVFLMLGGSASVAYAEQWVSSGLAALAIATTPIWSVLFAGIWKRRPTRIEWAGLIVGLAGVVLLNFEGDFRASPLGAAALMLAPMSWAFGSVWSQQVRLPKGMMAGAAQMMTGGGVVMAVGFAMGERVTAFPGWRTISAVAYLGVVGSLVGFSAYVSSSAGCACPGNELACESYHRGSLGIWLMGRRSRRWAWRRCSSSLRAWRWSFSDRGA
jgi:drug/metabolite transporter (DMT)-like permease